MKKTLAFITALLMWTGLYAETVKTKQIDGGGTEMFKAIAVKDSEMPDFVIYRPQDLMLAHARQGELPVLMWGNGACLDSSIDYERFLTEIASHGYIVMAIGEMQDNRDDRKTGHSESAELKRGLDWLLKQNSTKGSDYYNNIDTLKVAAAGHSCGGAQVLANAADPRLKTCLIMNAGMGDMEMVGASRESLPKVHTPILYVTGGPDDVAYHNARMDFERLSHVPVALADHPASGHGGTYGQQNGGDYARLVVDWLDWQLKGNNDNAETFLGGEAKGYNGWTIKAKNFVDFQSFKSLWIMNGDRQIYGELFTPQGESKGVAIVSHGFNGTHHSGRSYFDLMQKLGYKCYVFDFPCGSVNSRSDNNTLNMSILDEQSDLRAIVNHFKRQDPNQEIVLIGESQGGLISALTAAQMKDDISKLILVFPALCIPDNWRQRYPKVSDIPEVTDLWGVKLGKLFFEEIHDMKPLELIGNYRGPVLIVQGDRDRIVSMEDSEKAQKLYNEARLHVIPGAGHGFNPKERQKLKEQITLFFEVPKALPIGSVPMGNLEDFPEYQLDLGMADGPFKANWESIEANYPGSPEWLRDAKFGIWVHFGPQSAGQSGDWYARNLYKEDHKAYANHIKNFGHPSKIGYKDVLRDWSPDNLNPEYLTDLYHKAGARFLMIQGVHHDNYDLWDSQYQPWNSVNIGPHRDLLREWADACRKHDMRYGVTFHHEYTWWWWQTAFGADSLGEFAGVPYDGNLTLEDGKGQWWEGYDPRLLYGVDLREYETVDANAHSPWSPPKAGIFSNHLDYAKWYAKQWAQRIMDVTENYDPDFIYTDGTVQGPFTGDGTGAGFKSNAMPHVMADYYNKMLKNRGKVDGFSIIKFRNPTNGAVNTAEFDFPDTINSSQPWIREAPVGDWFYAPDFTYDSGMMIKYIIEAIARDGNAALNICLLPDGSIEPECVRMLEEVGDWMDRNGEAVYGSRAWHKLGEGVEKDGKLRKLPGGKLGKRHAEFQFSPEDFRFTKGKNGSLYAFCMTVPEGGTDVMIKSLAKGAKEAPEVRNVTLLGHENPLKWTLTDSGLSVTLPSDLSDFSSALVFRID